MISIICAMGKNRAIGRRGRLLWRIPADLNRFRRVTLRHAVIMGRKTFESIGGPLPDRENIVLSRTPDFRAGGCSVCGSVADAVALAERIAPDGGKEIFVIGGAEIYSQMLPIADKLYLTLINAEPKDADAFFPDYSDFNKILRREDSKEAGISCSFVELAR